ncbi:uncharacterized protein [Phyllobates terribilis]|uniref:uncharacterized protein n=1 Tax=Phyllobates terribilis TaxID=111132 RepID=UPI003CCB4430
MPSCLVNQCVSKTGKRGQNGQVILHPFPKDVSRIKVWLQQTGQIFKDLNALAQKIFDENKQNKYRLCSCHFTIDSYIINIHGRSLRVDAVPSIFPVVKEGECIIEENLRKDRVRKRKRRFDPGTNSLHHDGIDPPMIDRINVEEDMFQDYPTSYDYESLRIIKVEEDSLEDPQWPEIEFRDVGTQTDHTLVNSILVFKDCQPMEDDVLEKPQSPDVHPITVEEELESCSETDVSTRYWKVENSGCGEKELLLQD